MYKAGIIGCGKIAQVRHIPEYLELEEVEIAGYYDINRDRAKQLASLYGGRAYETYEELLADKEIDAVSVCAANHVHAEISIKALNADKHVLCEKPMAVSLEECRAMVEASKATGKLLMIGHNQRLAKAHRKAKELILKGAIGKIITFQTIFVHGGPESWSVDSGKNVWFFDKKSAAMGAMADLGIHKTDLIQYLTGERVEEVTAVMAVLDKKGEDGGSIEVDDNAFCIYKMTNGIVGTLTAGWSCYGEEKNSTIFYGTEGVMRIYDDPRYSIIIEGKDGSTAKYSIGKIQTNDNQTSSGVIELFINSIRTNTLPDMNGEEILSAMRVVFACEKSSREGRTILLDGGN